MYEENELLMINKIKKNVLRFRIQVNCYIIFFKTIVLFPQVALNGQQNSVKYVTGSLERVPSFRLHTSIPLQEITTIDFGKAKAKILHLILFIKI